MWLNTDFNILCNFVYKKHIVCYNGTFRQNLQGRDNLQTTNKTFVPNVSIVRRFHALYITTILNVGKDNDYIDSMMYYANILLECSICMGNSRTKWCFIIAYTRFSTLISPLDHSMNIETMVGIVHGWTNSFESGKPRECLLSTHEVLLRVLKLYFCGLYWSWQFRSLWLWICSESIILVTFNQTVL